MSAPLLVSATPADNSGAVAVSNNIVLTFNENVFFGTGNLVVSDGYTQSFLDKGGAMQTHWIGATDVRSVAASDSQITISGNVVTINLANDLKGGLNYGVYIPRGFLVDANNLPFAGLLDSSKLNFVTAGGVAAPTAHIGAITSFEDSGISNSDFITNSAAQTVHGTYTGTLGVNDNVQVSVDNGATWHIADAAAGSWTCSGFDALTASSNLVARVVNVQGVSSGSVSHSYVFDNTPPTVLSTTISDHNLTDGETATVTITFSEAVGNFSILNATVNSASYGPWTSVDNGLSWSATVTPNTLTLANNVSDQFSVGGTDAAGNQISGSLVTVPNYAINTTDGLAITAISADSGVDQTDFVTNIAAQNISGTLAAALPAGSHVQVSMDNGSSWNNAVVNGTSWTYSGATLLPGDNAILARIIDSGNNTSTPLSHNYSYDTTAPQMTDSTPTASNDSVSPTIATITLNFNETMFLHGTDSFLLTDGNANSDQHFSMADSNVSINAGVVTITLQQTLDGTSNYHLYLEHGSFVDTAGNTATDANSNPLDATSGHVDLLDFTTGAGPLATPGFSFTDSATASDPGNEAHDNISNNGTVNISGVTGNWDYSINGGGSWTQGSGTSFVLAEGTYSVNQVQVRQNDGTHLSNAATNSFVFVVDQTPPDAGLSPDLTAFRIDANSQHITGGYSYTNNSDVHVEVSFNGGSNWTRATLGTPSNGANTWSVDGVASQPIAVRLTDSAGNASTVDGNPGTIAYIGSTTADSFTNDGSQIQYGGEGNDSFTLQGNLVGRIAGGADTDTLILATGNGLTLDNFGSDQISGIDILQVSGQHQTLAINDAAILDDWTDDVAGDHTLTIIGDNTIQLDIWGAGFTANGNDGTYNLYYHQNGSHFDYLKVAMAIDVRTSPP
jgi:hypothetical protein